MLQLSSGIVLKSDNRQIPDIEWTIEIADANIERRRNGMVAHVQRVMTGAAGAGERGQSQHSVYSCYAGDVDRLGIEKRLAARNTRALLVAIFAAQGTRPRVIQGEDRICEWSAKWVEAEAGRKGIVNADVEWLRRER